MAMNDITMAATWFTKAILIVVSLPLGLIFARIFTDNNFRKSSWADRYDLQKIQVDKSLTLCYNQRNWILPEAEGSRWKSDTAVTTVKRKTLSRVARQAIKVLRQHSAKRILRLCIKFACIFRTSSVWCCLKSFWAMKNWPHTSVFSMPFCRIRQRGFLLHSYRK